MRCLADHRAALGLPKAFTTHSTRHAFTSWCAESGISVDVANRCTAHVITTGINAKYNHASLNGPAKLAWAAWANWLNGK